MALRIAAFQKITTVCKESAVSKLAEDDYLNRILRGESVKCRHKINQKEVVQMRMLSMSQILKVL